MTGPSDAVTLIGRIVSKTSPHPETPPTLIAFSPDSERPLRGHIERHILVYLPIPLFNRDILKRISIVRVVKNRMFLSSL